MAIPGSTSEPVRAAGRPQRLRLGDILVAQKVISPEQLKLALDEQKRSGHRLGRALIDLGFTAELNIAQALARLLKKDIEPVVVAESEVSLALDRVYRRTEEISGLVKELQQDLGENLVDFGALGATLGAEDAPVVKLLQSLFQDATQVGASDIHIEPQEDKLRIRFRIDGQLQAQAETELRVAAALALRLKLMAALDISEKRHPQDGRFNVLVRQQPVDVRISTMPTNYGESVVMRLLNRQSGVLGLESLGMPDRILGRFREIVHRVSGMVVVTGPTGSGKTTTLYSALNELIPRRERSS